MSKYDMSKYEIRLYKNDILNATLACDTLDNARRLANALIRATTDLTGVEIFTYSAPLHYGTPIACYEKQNGLWTLL
jgi:hypothetical protein